LLLSIGTRNIGEFSQMNNNNNKDSEEFAEDYDEIKCLRCSTKLLYLDNRVKCPNCLFYNDVLPEKTFVKMLKESEIYSDSGFPYSDLDPLIIISKDLTEEVKQYAYPDIKKKIFTHFQKRSPLTAESFLKFLEKGKDALTKEEDTRLRVLKVEHSAKKLRKKLNYLQSKLAIVEYLEKTNLR
jgi:hypothetical protein